MSFLKQRATRTLISAAFLVGAFAGAATTGIASTILGSSIFSDVQSGSFYDSAVGTMYSLGVIKGYNSRTFGPNDYVTRGQLAVMLDRFRTEVVNGNVVQSSSRSSTSSVSSASSSSSSSVSSSSSTMSYSSYGVRLTQKEYVVAESAGSVKIGVTRTGGAKGTVSVDYATTDGTAVNGTDYTTTKGTLTLLTNETSKTFSISVSNNPIAQGNKNFTITLSNPVGSQKLANPGVATVTITDNQTVQASSTSSTGTASSSSSANPAGTLGLNAATYMVNEKAGSIVITVARAGGSTGVVGVNYGTSNGTATSGSDYTTVTGTLTFNAGETTKTFSIPVIANSNITGNKSFNIILGTVTGGASLGAAGATVTLFDDESGTFDSGTLKFVKNVYSVSKSAGTVGVTVLRTGGTVGTVSVNYATTNGTAAAGTAFTYTSGTLTFLPGEASKVIVIPIANKADSPGKTFTVEITDVTAPAVLSSPTSTTVSIES